MEKEDMRYYPLINAKQDGTEKIAMMLTTDIEKLNAMYLAAMIPGYFRLCAKNPVKGRSSRKWILHCPQCSGKLRQIAKGCSETKLGLYTCDRCR